VSDFLETAPDRLRNPVVIVATEEGIAVFADDPSDLEIYLVDARDPDGAVVNGARPIRPADFPALLRHFGTLPVVRRLWYRINEDFSPEDGEDDSSAA
jgi:hypothetical protein